MNENSIEQAICDYLEEQLDGEQVIRKGTEIRQRPVGELLVIIAVREVPKDAGNLYRGILTVLVQTPIIMNDDGSPKNQPSDHGALVSAVEAVINPRINPSASNAGDEAARVQALKTAFDQALTTTAQCTCGGVYADGPKSAHDDKHWISTIEVILGLQRN